MNTTALVRAGTLGLALAGAFLATPAWADCTPAAADGVTAICTGTTNGGYGTGTETGVTVTVENGATVTGSIFTGDGTTVTNGAGASISGIAAFQGSANVTNSGSITSSTYGISAGTNATVTNNASAVITGGDSGIFANAANVTNSGSIIGTLNYGIFANINVTVTNNVGGVITGDFTGISAGFFSNVTNSGSIVGSGQFGVYAGANATVTNNTGGSITGSYSGIYSIGNATVTNNAGGSITGSQYGIDANGGGSSVFNAGSIISGIAAIRFGGTSNTLTLGPGSAIAGNVLGTGSDTFQLGGTGAATFDVSELGSKYQGFSTFNKIGSSVWTLTGTPSGSTNWSLLDGTLSISNFNTLGIFSSLTFNGGTLRFTGASAASLSNFTWGDHGGGFDVSDAAGTLIVSGSMSGTGGLTKLGAGALTLTGTSDYTGATSVNAGTLAAGVAGAFSSFSAYTVASGARLDLNGHDQTIGSLAGAGSVELAGTLTTGVDNTSTLFSGVIGGNGGLTKTGTGAMTLSGTNTYTGATTVDSGTLVVNGSIASSSGVTVNNGGILGGTGQLPTAVINSGGTLAPGNSIGTITVNGNLAFNAGSFYKIEVSPTAADRTNVLGTATLTGATVQAVALPGSFRAQTYTILNATGGFGGTQFAGLTGDTFAPTRNPHLTYDANNVFLVLDPGTLVLPNGVSGNQKNVAGAINKAVEGGFTPPAGFDALLNMGGSQLTNALKQVSGEIGGNTQSTSFQASTQFMNIMSDPTAAGRGGAGSGASASGYADEAMAYAAKRSNNPRDAFASFTKAPPVAFVQRWSTWAMGYGGSQTTDGNVAAGTNTSSSNIYGVAVGADYSFSPDTVAGFALSGGGTNYSVVNGGTGRSDMFQLGAFVRHNIGATYLTASAAYGWQDVKTDRYVTVAGVDHLKAEFNTNSYSGRLELGHRFLQPWFGGLGVSPYAAVQITAFELPAYAEQAVTGNNTFALAYGANTSTATRSELGVRTDKSYALDGAVLTLRGRAAWAHDFNPNSNVTATFQTLPGASFVVNGAALAPDAALTTASAELSWMNGWSVAGTFEGEFSNVTRSYAGKGVVRYNW